MESFDEKRTSFAIYDRKRGAKLNRKRDTYDRITVGERIRNKRILLGMSQDELAEKIDRATKYCSDIERGVCGMSIETMLALSSTLDMSLDYMLFGTLSKEEKQRMVDDESAIIHALSQCTPKQRNSAIQMLQLFVASMPK